VSAARSWRDVLTSVGDVVGTDQARWLASQASGYTAAELALRLDDPVPARVSGRLSAMVDRRASGVPLQYVIGRWAFRTLDLMVDERVFIPRPETEQVVEVALAEARRLAAERGRGGEPGVVVDLGTGSGAIALSLAAELPGVQVWASDLSAGALEVASANLCGLAGRAATRVRLAQGCWFDALPAKLRGQLDMVVSNPPYVADGETLPAEVADWEPTGALRAGATGLECLTDIVSAAPSWLGPGGVLIVELAPDQAGPVAALALASGFAEAEVRTDLAGRERMVVARR
jgi:release factor glutamine methyltransferase